MKKLRTGLTLVCLLIATFLSIPLTTSTQLAQTIQLPKGLTYVWWRFGVPEFEDFQIDITIHNEIGRLPGMYFQMYQGQIGDVGFYFGLQTDISRPQSGGGGRGLIFSRWKTRDLANTRPVRDGWTQSAGFEGDFVGIRRNYAWTNHKYRLRLTKVDEDRIGVWYGLFILDYDTRTEDYVGALRFPRQGRSAKIKDGGGTWTEVYSGASQVSDLPQWHISIDGCYVNNRKSRAIEANSDYSPIPNTDIYLDPNSRSVHFLIGNGVIRKHPKGRLF